MIKNFTKNLFKIAIEEWRSKEKHINKFLRKVQLVISLFLVEIKYYVMTSIFLFILIGKNNCLYYSLFPHLFLLSYRLKLNGVSSRVKYNVSTSKFQNLADLDIFSKTIIEKYQVDIYVDRDNLNEKLDASCVCNRGHNYIYLNQYSENFKDFKAVEALILHELAHLVVMNNALLVGEPIFLNISLEKKSKKMKYFFNSITFPYALLEHICLFCEELYCDYFSFYKMPEHYLRMLDIIDNNSKPIDVFFRFIFLKRYHPLTKLRIYLLKDFHFGRNVFFCLLNLSFSIKYNHFKFLKNID